MTLPSFITAQLLVSIILNVVLIHVILITVAYLVILITVAYLVYFERKIAAYVQDRIGPNRVGFDFGLPFLSFLKGCLGLGQPLADGIKFMLKEDYTPNRVDKVLFTLAPAIIVIPALIGFVVVPWGGSWNCPDIHIPFTALVIPGGVVQITGATVNVGVIYMLAVASLGAYGITLGGWASNNKYSFLGGLRATAQMISYEIPLGLALLAAVLIIGSFVPDQIVRYQVQHGWMIVAQPVAAIIFFIAILAEANRSPFDNAEAEQELVGGYHTEYSSMRFALYFLAEYAHLFTSTAFFTMLFLGGYHLPFVSLLSPENVTILAVVAKLVVFFTKVVLIVCFSMVIRWTIPRMRYDQVMMMAWGAVIPISLLVVVVNSCLVYFDRRDIPTMLIANAGIVVVTLLVHPWMPKTASNRRLPLYGSRFSPVPGERVRTAPSEAMALEDRPVQGSAPQTISR